MRITSAILPSAYSTVVVTTLIQVLTSLSSVAVPVLAPDAGRELGFSPTLVGYFVGITYLFGSTSALLTGSLVLRYGSIRVSQGALLLLRGRDGACWRCCRWRAMPLAALLPRFMGYGADHPGLLHVLAKTTPPHMMSLMFSAQADRRHLLGGALAGIMLPPIVTGFSWRVAAVTVAVMCIAHHR